MPRERVTPRQREVLAQLADEGEVRARDLGSFDQDRPGVMRHSLEVLMDRKLIEPGTGQSTKKMLPGDDVSEFRVKITKRGRAAVE